MNELVKGDAANAYINNEYYIMYKNVRTQFISALTTIILNLFISSTGTPNPTYTLKRIFIGGYKLGGVIAALSSFDVLHCLPQSMIQNMDTLNGPKIHLSLFDTPRIGNPVFALKLYDNVNNVWRFNHVSDTAKNVGSTSSFTHPSKYYININVNNTTTPPRVGTTEYFGGTGDDNVTNTYNNANINLSTQIVLFNKYITFISQV